MAAENAIFTTGMTLGERAASAPVASQLEEIVMFDASNFINRWVGRIKQLIAEVLGDENLRREGEIDEKKGKEEKSRLPFSRNLHDLS